MVSHALFAFPPVRPKGKSSHECCISARWTRPNVRSRAIGDGPARGRLRFGAPCGAAYLAASRSDESLAILPRFDRAARPEGAAGAGRRASRRAGSSSGRSTQRRRVRIERPEGRPHQQLGGDSRRRRQSRRSRHAGRGRPPACEVTVEQSRSDASWSFRNHVQSVLTKAGCNSGACHGAAAGKNGFKLSLRGYDPEADFLTITRQAARPADRAERSGPQPVADQADGCGSAQGGLAVRRRLARVSRAGRMDRRRAAGPQAERSADRTARNSPRARVLKKGAEQQFLVRAHFTTATAKTSRPGPSSLDQPNGLPGRRRRQGEGHGQRRRLDRRLVPEQERRGHDHGPLREPAAGRDVRQGRPSQFHRRVVLEKLQPERPPVAGLLGRRIPPPGDLDTIGVLPTADEVRAFLADRGPTNASG